MEYRKEGAGIVQADQAAVANHVRVNDGDQLPAADGLAGEVRTDASGAHEQHAGTMAGAADKCGPWPMTYPAPDESQEG